MCSLLLSGLSVGQQPIGGRVAREAFVQGGRRQVGNSREHQVPEEGKRLETHSQVHSCNKPPFTNKQY